MILAAWAKSHCFSFPRLWCFYAHCNQNQPFRLQIVSWTFVRIFVQKTAFRGYWMLFWGLEIVFVCFFTNKSKEKNIISHGNESFPWEFFCVLEGVLGYKTAHFSANQAINKTQSTDNQHNTQNTKIRRFSHNIRVCSLISRSRGGIIFRIVSKSADIAYNRLFML